MKVTSIKVRKKSPIKSGIYTVEVKYTTETDEDTEKTDVFEWDIIDKKGNFPNTVHFGRRIQLAEIVEAYFTLMFYGFIEKSDEE